MNYCYAVAKGHRALRAYFSEGLQIIEESGEYQEILDKWINIEQPHPIDMVQILRYAALVLVPLLLFVLLIAGWNWSLRSKVTQRTRDIQQRLQYEQLLAYVSSLAVSENDVNVILKKSLKAIGEASSVSRVYIFRKESAESISNTHEWCAPGITPQKETLQNLPVESFSWWFDSLLNNRNICVSDIEQISDGNTREELRRQGIIAVLAVPMFVRGMFYGFMGLDKCLYSRRWPDENVDLLVSISQIICGFIERDQAEQALVASEQRFRLLVESSPDAIYVQTGGQFAYLNKAALKMFNFEEEKEPLGRSVLDVFDPDFREIEQERMRLLNDEKENVPLLEEICIRDDGTTFHAEVAAAPINYEGSDGAIVFVRDISGRQALENQLYQAQKMESIGRLAGGVAHDYNNLLQVILGNVEIALAQTDESSEMRECLKEIRQAGEQSVDVTRQLLAFARKQTIRPQVVDLNQSVERILKMLRTLLGETIELRWNPGAKTSPVEIDPGQFDQIMMNLCVNARDAMEGTGKIVIATQTVVLKQRDCEGRDDFMPGKFVRLSVTDDGCGMDAGTVRQIFEPFFTTKEVGAGTGLGLSTVCGIVRQNHGFVDVESSPDKGTSFRLYFPVYKGRTGHADGEQVTAEDEEGSSTILLVEDEKSILKTVRMILESAGYEVITASRPGIAIRMAREHVGDIDLLMTDVVMPEMNGRELAGHIIAYHPKIKRLFMSGYTADVIARHGVLDEGVNFIQKPFSRGELFAKLKEVLGSK